MLRLLPREGADHPPRPAEDPPEGRETLRELPPELLDGALAEDPLEGCDHPRLELPEEDLPAEGAEPRVLLPFENVRGEEDGAGRAAPLLPLLPRSKLRGAGREELGEAVAPDGWLRRVEFPERLRSKLRGAARSVVIDFRMLSAGRSLPAELLEVWPNRRQPREVPASGVA